MNCEDATTCPVHGEVIVSIVAVSSKIKILLALVGIGLVIVATCVTISVAANNSSGAVRQDFEVHSAGQDQRIKNIEQGIVRNTHSLERIETLLRKE